MRPITKTKNDSKISLTCAKKILKKSKNDPKFIVDENGLPNSITTIECLPNDLIVDILSCVAATSISGFFNAKLSWKLFNKLAEDNDHLMYNKLSIDKLSCHPMDISSCKKTSSIFMKCLKNQNLEAMYRQGVIEYLNFHKKKESGLELLKKAADAGHFGSCYFLGILLICKEEDESETRQNTQQGLQLLGRIETSVQMGECCEKLKMIADSLWLTQNHDFLQPNLFECQFSERKRSSWPCADDSLCCRACRLNSHIVQVCNIVTGGSSFSCQICYEW